MDEQHAIELCVKHRDPVGFEFLVQKYRREAYRHAFALLGNAEDAVLEQVWKSPYSRFARNASLVMIIAGYAVLIGYGVYEVLTSGREEVPAKMAMAAIVLGFLILLGQLIRERVKTYKTDPYKEIER